VRGPGRFAIGLTAGLFATTFGADSAFRAGLWIPVAAPAMGWFTTAAVTTAYMAYREATERGVLKKLFEPYVDSRVVEKILKDPEDLLKDGRLKQEKVIATVLFTDMVGYSTVSEGFGDPKALMQWLDEYLSTMSRVVTHNGGMVNKYIGDAVMAIFGVPIPKGRSADARNAVTCALDMREALVRLNKRFKQRGIPEIGMRIGIATGELVAGSLGNKKRLEYTVIGDIVNTASRLESGGKDKPMPEGVFADGCRIMIAGPPMTATRAGTSTYELVAGEFEMCRVEVVEKEGLKGKQNRIEIYGVIGLSKPTADYARGCFEISDATVAQATGEVRGEIRAETPAETQKTVLKEVNHEPAEMLLGDGEHDALVQLGGQGADHSANRRG
jgi:adenylate cyclase